MTRSAVVAGILLALYGCHVTPAPSVPPSPPVCPAAPACPAPPAAAVVVDVPPAVLLASPEPPPGIIEMLKRDEGLRLKSYRDSRGNWTVGYGRNLRGRGITEPEAMHLLKNDIQACQAELDTHLAWWRLLTAKRQLAVLGLCYNLGIHGLKAFKKALASMESGDYPAAAKHFLDSLWAKQVGKRARQLTRMIETNEAPAS